MVSFEIQGSEPQGLGSMVSTPRDHFGMGVCILSCFSHVQLFAIPWTVACQAPLSLGLLRQEYWSGLPFPPAGDLPNPEIEPRSALQADSLVSENTREAHEASSPQCQNKEMSHGAWLS